MKKIILLKILTLVLIYCILAHSCTKSECDFGGPYDFVIPATLSPAQEMYAIGDTITVTSIFGCDVYEKKTDQTYPLKDFRFFPQLRIREMSDTVANEAGLLDFEVLVDTIYDFSQFNYSSGAVEFFGQYLQEDTIYKLSYQLIPKKRGLYEFSFFSELNFIDQEFEGMCTRKRMNNCLTLNEGADNNVHLLEESPNPLFNTLIFQAQDLHFHRVGGYCFRVK